MQWIGEKSPMATVRRAVGGVAQGEAEMQAHELARSRPKKKDS